MKLPTYTPYDGTARPFTIGLRPLDPGRWIEPDGELERYIREKKRLAREHFDEIFVAEDDTEAAQQEALDLISARLSERHPRMLRGDASALPPLVKAGLLVQDDLVVMRRRQDGWRLVAGHVSFPSSWSLREKFGRPMHEIHADVPGFGGGTRNAVLITRIFDNLQVARPVERLNWSVNATADLFLPVSKHRRPPAADAFTLEERFVRVERQTLSKLPASGDILFTIRIYVDPVAAIARHPRAAELAASFAGQLEALDEAQAAYKGLTLQRAELARRLRALSPSDI
ncbi:heme-dependent oxidative N-demethylase family protein [Rhizobium binxianense]